MNRAVHLALAVSLTAACASQPESTRYYLLEPGTVASSAALVTDVRELAVGPVTVSAYLDQPQIVTRAGDDVVELSAGDRWAMPLADAVRELLLRRLAARLPNTNITSFPGSSEPSKGARRVAIELFRLDGSVGGEARIAAQWRLFNPVKRTWNAAQAFTESSPTAGDAIRDLVVAQGVLLERLADVIAQSLQTKVAE